MARTLAPNRHCVINQWRLNLLAWVVLCLLGIGMTGCSQQTKVPPFVKAKSLAGYSMLAPDQEALLRIRLAIILQHMQRLENPVMLDAWFRASNPQERRRWMSFLYCNDQVLGRLQSYESSQVLLLKDERASKQAKAEVFNAHVITQRQHESEVQELFVFQQNHLDFQVIGYFVKPNKNIAYYNCLSHI